MDPITQTAASNLLSLAEYGIAGLFLSLLIIGGVFILRYFMVHCEKRTEANTSALEKRADASDAVIEKNTEAFHSLNITLTELKGKLEK